MKYVKGQKVIINGKTVTTVHKDQTFDGQEIVTLDAPEQPSGTVTLSIGSVQPYHPSTLGGLTLDGVISGRE